MITNEEFKKFISSSEEKLKQIKAAEKTATAKGPSCTVVVRGAAFTKTPWHGSKEELENYIYNKYFKKNFGFKYLKASEVFNI